MNPLVSSPLGRRRFRIFWAGESISLLGDQFYVIGLPWLILQSSGGPFEIGVALALAGLPRTLFMLLGGAASDRWSPRDTLLAANIARLALTGGLAWLTLTGRPGLPEIYMIAALIGLADAFYYPAQSAIVPSLVSENQLHQGNALLRGSMYLAFFAGPALAGIVISYFSAQFGEAAGNLPGPGIAFAIDAATFALSIASLVMIGSAGRLSAAPPERHLFGTVRDGLRQIGNDPSLRDTLLIVAGLNLLLFGPLLVGIPVLAAQRFSGGSAAFGLIMSGLGGGSLLGAILAGVLPRPAAKFQGAILLAFTALTGGVLASIGLLTSTTQAAAGAFAIGAATGYITVLYLTWLQKRTPRAMMGRAMALFMLASVGLLPLSHVIAGTVIEASSGLLFAGAGSAIVAIALIGTLSPHVRKMGVYVSAEVADRLTSSESD